MLVSDVRVCVMSQLSIVLQSVVLVLPCVPACLAWVLVHVPGCPRCFFICHAGTISLAATHCVRRLLCVCFVVTGLCFSCSFVALSLCWGSCRHIIDFMFQVMLMGGSAVRLLSVGCRAVRQSTVCHGSHIGRPLMGVDILHVLLIHW